MAGPHQALLCSPRSPLWRPAAGNTLWAGIPWHGLSRWCWFPPLQHLAFTVQDEALEASCCDSLVENYWHRHKSVLHWSGVHGTFSYPMGFGIRPL